MIISEEAKKKISEGLKNYWASKGAGKMQEPKSEEGKKLFKDYNSSVSVSNDLENKNNGLKAKLSALKKGKGNAALKNKIRLEIKANNDKLKAENKTRKELRAKTVEAKRKSQATNFLKKLDEKKKQTDSLEKKIQGSLSKAKTTEQKDRINQSLNRIKELRTRMAESEQKANDVISGKKSKPASIFDFTEHLSEGKLWREVTNAEAKVDFIRLAESLDDIDQEIADELERIYRNDVIPKFEQMEKKIEQGFIAPILAYWLLTPTRIEQIIKKAQTISYQAGKEAAQSELNKVRSISKPGVADSGKANYPKVELPSNPAYDISAATFQRKSIAESFANDINNEAKSTILDGLAKGIGAAAIITAVKDNTESKFDQYAANIAGTVSTENLNRGRAAVFQANKFIISAYQRSEILDEVTCAICVSLDERIVKADDPMAKLDIIHTNCRGIWVPITKNEEIEGTIGLPKTIVDSFKTVGGVPVVNSFNQLKKRLPKKNNAKANDLI